MTSPYLQPVKIGRCSLWTLEWPAAVEDVETEERTLHLHCHCTAPRSTRAFAIINMEDQKDSAVHAQPTRHPLLDRSIWSIQARHASSSPDSGLVICLWLVVVGVFGEEDVVVREEITVLLYRTVLSWRNQPQQPQSGEGRTSRGSTQDFEPS